MQKNWTKTTQPTFDRDGALRMNEIATTVFAPIYPVIAQNAIAATAIRRGVCLDLGSGSAMLAMAVARLAPQMQVIAFDFSTPSMQIAMENIAAAQLEKQIRCETGDVHALPFADGTVDLIVSRGSMFFWDDLENAFREIYRVLAPGGATHIGGGFGSAVLRDQVVAEMLKRDPTWDCYARKKTASNDIQRFGEMFRKIGCHTYRIVDDETGFWIVLSKP
jgi:ubiquinone/menaquinone biosynthesis C-methylase UbiE